MTFDFVINLWSQGGYDKKEGLDKDKLVNDRPFSNLNTISKILEKLYLNRLKPHIVLQPDINRFQSAYRPRHSTETALTVYDRI